MLSLPTPLKTLLLLLIITVSAVGTMSLSTYIVQGRPVNSPLLAAATPTSFFPPSPTELPAPATATPTSSRGSGSGGVGVNPTIAPTATPRLPTSSPGRCGSTCNMNLRNCDRNAFCQPISPGSSRGICVQTSCTTSNPCCRTNVPVTRAPTASGGGMTPVPAVSGGGIKPSAVATQPTGAKQPPVDRQPSISPNPQAGILGDCSGATPGVPDGKVDLLDFRQLSLEFTTSVSTLHCDFDKNGAVDLIDFNDYFRRGFTAS